MVNGDNYSRHFLLAQSLLTTGEIDKATDHFLIAADGLGMYICEYTTVLMDTPIHVSHNYTPGHRMGSWKL